MTTRYTLVWKVKDGYYLSMELPRLVEEHHAVAMAQGLAANGAKGVELMKEEETTKITKVKVFDE
jgi:hypothetical protein